MRPETAAYLAKARECLGTAATTIGLPVPSVAGKEAYLAGYHAAEAFIFERTGRAVKTHRGVRSSFARVARSEPRIDRAFTQFLGRGYMLKERADYGIGPEGVVTLAQAQEALATARRFVDCVAGLLEEEGE